MDLPSLPADIDAELGDLAEAIMAAREVNDFDLVLELTEASWQLLPEPKANWNFEPQAIAFGAVEDIILAGRADLGDLLDTWAERVYSTYFDPDRENLLLLMLHGHALFRVGREAEARTVFQFVHDTGGPDWFGGDYAPYRSLVS